MEIVLPAHKYSSAFRGLLLTDSRYVIAFGGRGSGKTHHIMLKLLLKSFESEYNHILYVNQEFRHIKTQQYSDFKKVAKSLVFGVNKSLYDFFTWRDGDYRIINNISGTVFTPIGMDDSEKTKGISDPTIIWWDEITKGSLEGFLSLNALLRTPLNKRHQFIVSFNPVSDKHWVRKYFFDKDSPYRLIDSFNDCTYVSHTTYLDNDFIDKGAYLATLSQNAMGNPNRMLVDIEGRWGVTTNTNPFFYSFNEAIHCSKEKYYYDTQQFLDISFDFNKDPCTAVIGQRMGNSWHIFDVITANENTSEGLSPLESLCLLIRARYKDVAGSRYRVTGDASGKQGGADSMAGKNFYTTIARTLKISPSQINVRATNLGHSISRDVCNYPLYRLPIYFHNVDILTNEIVMASPDEKGTLNKDKKEHGLHTVDAWRYLMDFWFNSKNNFRDYVDSLCKK